MQIQIRHFSSLKNKNSSQRKNIGIPYPSAKGICRSSPRNSYVWKKSRSISTINSQIDSRKIRQESLFRKQLIWKFSRNKVVDNSNSVSTASMCSAPRNSSNNSNQNDYINNSVKHKTKNLNNNNYSPLHVDKKANNSQFVKSPSILQHKFNLACKPWFAWKDTALKKAEELNRVIFLSVGYRRYHMSCKSTHNRGFSTYLRRSFSSINPFDISTWSAFSDPPNQLKFDAINSVPQSVVSAQDLKENWKQISLEEVDGKMWIPKGSDWYFREDINLEMKGTKTQKTLFPIMYALSYQKDIRQFRVEMETGVTVMATHEIDSYQSLPPRKWLTNLRDAILGQIEVAGEEVLSESLPDTDQPLQSYWVTSKIVDQLPFLIKKRCIAVHCGPNFFQEKLSTEESDDQTHTQTGHFSEAHGRVFVISFECPEELCKAEDPLWQKGNWILQNLEFDNFKLPLPK